MQNYYLTSINTGVLFFNFKFSNFWSIIEKLGFYKKWGHLHEEHKVTVKLNKVCIFRDAYVMVFQLLT